MQYAQMVVVAKLGNDDFVDRLRGMQIAEQKGGFDQGLHVVFNDDLMGAHEYFPPEKRTFYAMDPFVFWPWTRESASTRLKSQRMR